jgi:hypothetical protein
MWIPFFFKRVVYMERIPLHKQSYESWNTIHVFYLFFPLNISNARFKNYVFWENVSVFL